MAVTGKEGSILLEKGSNPVDGSAVRGEGAGIPDVGEKMVTRTQRPGLSPREKTTSARTPWRARLVLGGKKRGRHL